MESGEYSRGAPELHDMLAEYMWTESPAPVLSLNKTLCFFLCLLSAWFFSIELRFLPYHCFSAGNGESFSTFRAGQSTGALC